jgi:hypothetical protein
MSFQDRSSYDDFLEMDKTRSKKLSGLSPEEAHRVLQLEYLLEQERSHCCDYLLMRASFSTNKVEKKAWWILTALLSFVERRHRFPHFVEMNQFLGIVLGKGLPKLPLLHQIDLNNLRSVADQLRIYEKKTQKEFSTQSQEE